eukprot:COSAG02_NODE_6204_length_3730_cov_5.065822_1_plen_166_part_00
MYTHTDLVQRAANAHSRRINCCGCCQCGGRRSHTAPPDCYGGDRYSYSYCGAHAARPTLSDDHDRPSVTAQRARSIARDRTDTRALPTRLLRTVARVPRCPALPVGGQVLGRKNAFTVQNFLLTQNSSCANQFGEYEFVKCFCKMFCGNKLIFHHEQNHPSCMSL